jgi:hypothetical protein
MVARAFPGNLEEANRAGITPKIRVGTIDHSIGAICDARTQFRSLLLLAESVKADKLLEFFVERLQGFQYVVDPLPHPWPTS